MHDEKVRHRPWWFLYILIKSRSWDPLRYFNFEFGNDRTIRLRRWRRPFDRNLRNSGRRNYSDWVWLLLLDAFWWRALSTRKHISSRRDDLEQRFEIHKLGVRVRRYKPKDIGLRSWKRRWRWRWGLPLDLRKRTSTGNPLAYLIRFPVEILISRNRLYIAS